MAESIEDKDGYLIPGVGLNFELLDKIQVSGRNPSGTNTNISAGDESSLKQISSTEVQISVKNDRQLNDRCNGFLPRCQNANEPELIKSSQDSVRKTHQIADSSAWSVETVTVKSGKHRTNRVSGVNKDKIKGMELPDSVANIHNLIANRIISSHYRQTQPTRHSYGISCSNSTPGRRTTGPYHLKPIVNNKFQNKASYECADPVSSSLKGHNVNKQMANVSEGISSTGSPALFDRWDGGKNTRGLKQTTMLTSLPPEMEAPQDIMNKKTMMKRQCMYFPVDDYVILSPIPSACERNSSVTTVSPANTNDHVFEKQLSPMTISSGYESDYSPPWPSDMDKIFAKMLQTVCSNEDDSHTDYFSQSETYPRSVDVQEKCLLKPEENAHGPNHLSNPNNAGNIDEYDISNRSKTRCISGEKTVLGNGPYRVNNQTISDLNCKPARICFDKYFLNRGSTSSLDNRLRQRSSLESGSTVSLDNVNTNKDASLSGVKLVNGARRSKRYRFDVNRESLCKLNVESASSSELAKTFGDFEMQTTCSNVTSPRITPIDFFGVFKKSPTSNHCVETVSHNVSNRTGDQLDFKKEQVETNIGHTIVNNSVGDLSIDNIQPLKQNGDNLRCAKSPRGRLDTSDYEHIYDVIPGDEHVLSPSKYPSMATQLVRNKWSTLDDVRRPRNMLNGNPPALPVRSYLKDRGSNSMESISNTRVVCSSVDDLYARVNKREDKLDNIYATSVKYKPQITDITNKENVFCATKPGYDDDYEYLSSETYCRIGSCMEEKVTNWSSGDVLNFIDGINQPEPKCRENIYGLLSSRQVRAKLSESLEIENKLVNMGLLKNSWSCENVDTEEKPPIPPRAPLNNFRPIYV